MPAKKDAERHGLDAETKQQSLNALYSTTQTHAKELLAENVVVVVVVVVVVKVVVVVVVVVVKVVVDVAVVAVAVGFVIVAQAEPKCHVELAALVAMAQGLVL
jgi:Flp pilus assembly protein TadB